MSDHRHILTAPLGSVDHLSLLSEDIGQLFMQDEYCDVVLRVDGQTFAAHRVILASRSDYFKALLFGGMKESDEKEIELKDISATAFHHLLKYIYTGKINLSELNEEILLEVLGLAHQYVFKDLEIAISGYLKAILSIRNVCNIYDMACLYSLNELREKCCTFIDHNASDIMLSESFMSISKEALRNLIHRDSFCASEIEIFRAVQQWFKRNSDENMTDVVTGIRLPLMNLDELLKDVRDSSLIPPDSILDAIATKNKCTDMQLQYRGFLIPDENVANVQHGAQVSRGEMKASLLDGDNVHYDLDRGFTRHPIDDNNGQGIVVKLGKPFIINTVRMLLWDRDMRSYSFYIEVSMDDKDWVKIIDYSRYLCRSWQYLCFPPRVVRYIRIVGTHNTVNRVFHLVSFECLFSSKTFDIDNGIIIPKENVATIDKSACVIEGVSRSRNALINGDIRNYDWDSGYTCHQLGSGCILIQLSQPYLIRSMRLLLWDCDHRSYSYFIEVSTDNINWHTVANKMNEACRSWQTLVFEPTVVVFIKIVGTHNTANEVFHCVHFECPAAEAAIGGPQQKSASVDTERRALPGTSAGQQQGQQLGHSQQFAALNLDNRMPIADLEGMNPPGPNVDAHQ